jgi:hypothetical protein
LAKRPRQAGRPASTQIRQYTFTLPSSLPHNVLQVGPTDSYFPFHGISHICSLFAEIDTVFLSMFIFLNCLPTTHAPTTPLPRQNHLAPHLALPSPRPRAAAARTRARVRRHLPADAHHVRLRSASSVARSLRSPAFAVVQMSACRIPAVVLRTLGER